jgi:flagellin-like protein
MAKKGITPVIAIIILLFITIALAGATWTYLQSFLLGYTGKTFEVPQNAAYCANGILKVYVRNSGTLDLVSPSDFIIAEVDGQEARLGLKSVTLEPPKPPQEPGGSGLLFEWDCGGACSAGVHDIRLGTSTTTELLHITC